MFTVEGWRVESGTLGKVGMMRKRERDHDQDHDQDHDYGDANAPSELFSLNYLAVTE